MPGGRGLSNRVGGRLPEERCARRRLGQELPNGILQRRGKEVRQRCGQPDTSAMRTRPAWPAASAARQWASALPIRDECEAAIWQTPPVQGGSGKGAILARTGAAVLGAARAGRWGT